MVYEFGLPALVISLVAFFGTRFLARKSGQSNDKQGSAVGGLIFVIIGGIVLAVALGCVLFGVSGAIPGFIGLALFAAGCGICATATSS